jgi:hypothetical protein
MKINYNELDKSIEIKDGLKSHYFIMKMLMILTILNAILNLYDVKKNELGFMEIIWFILGIISLIILYFFIVKKSTLEKIPIEKIKRLNEKSIFGRKRFSIELNDGKKRDLTEMKSQAEFNELRKLFSEIGILN